MSRLEHSKWAIMVCLDGKDDWIFVTENTGKCDMWNLQPMLFNDIKDAVDYANVFALKGKEHNVKVVNYVEQV